MPPTVANPLNSSVAGGSADGLVSSFANMKSVSSDSEAIQEEWCYESCTWTP